MIRIEKITHACVHEPHHIVFHQIVFMECVALFLGVSVSRHV